MRKVIQSLPFRIAFGLLSPLLALAALLFVRRFGSAAPCWFHLLTGLHCPGCGSGRALTALLRGELAAALSYNFLFVMALPFLAYYLVKVYIRVVFHRDPLPFFSFSRGAGWTVTGVILAFWILRNIPAVPFLWLAP